MQSSPVSKKALTTNDDELEERKESERGYRLKRNTCIVTILAYGGVHSTYNYCMFCVEKRADSFVLLDWNISSPILYRGFVFPWLFRFYQIIQIEFIF